jgi:protein-S-isoprenylcysteine O-methyltransferase Ste14
MTNSGFFWILLAGAIFGPIHSLLATIEIKAKVESWLGEAGKKYYRFFYVVVASITTLAYASLVVIFPDKLIYKIPFPYVILTSLLEIGAIVGASRCVLDSRPMSFIGVDVLLNPKLSAPDEKLVTSGFYRLMRHPIYTFSLVALWLSPIMTWNLLALFLGITAYMLIGSWFEEQKLLRQFGEAYAEYQKKTPSFIPRLKR